MLDERISRLIHGIYAAADGSEPWSGALETLRALLRARMTSLLEYRGDDRPDRVHAAVGLDPAFRVSYETYYCRRNIYTARGQHLLTRLGSVAPHEAYCRDEEILRSEYYNDFQRRLGLFRVMAGAVGGGPREVLLVTVSRGRDQPSFSSRDLACLRWLTPHFQRGLRLQARMAGRSERSARLASGTAPGSIAAGAIRATSAADAIREPETARTACHLTAAEARFATLLVDGHSIAEICGQLEIRVSTARTHLRHLFQKTGTRRQAELVSALLRTHGD